MAKGHYSYRTVPYSTVPYSNIIIREPYLLQAIRHYCISPRGRHYCFPYRTVPHHSLLLYIVHRTRTSGDTSLLHRSEVGITLYSTVLCCTASYHTALHRIAPYSSASCAVRTSGDTSLPPRSEMEKDPAPQAIATPPFIHFLSSAKKKSLASIRATGLLNQTPYSKSEGGGEGRGR